MVWGCTSVILAVTTYNYFMNNPEYIFDSLLLLASSVTCMIAAIGVGDESERLPLTRRAQSIWTDVKRYASPDSDTLAGWKFISDARVTDHKLTMEPKHIRTI
jgi:hypothetical protein